MRAWRSPPISQAVATMLLAGVAACAAARPVDDALPGAPTSSAATASANEQGTPEWREVVPARLAGWLLSGGIFFADDSAVWRCIEEQCERFELFGGATRKSRLPCSLTNRFGRSNLTASPLRMVVAIRCGGELVTLRADGSQLGRTKAPLDSDQLVVDDDGVVTVTLDLGQDRWAIVRQRGEGPAERTEVSAPSPVEPGIGDLLGWTTGNSAHELAWVRATPPKPVPFSGLAFVNGERLWVSFSKGGYARRDGASLRPVSGAPKGGLPPHGVLLSDAPWGPNGMLFSYERAVVLANEELEAVHQIELPRISLSLSYGDERLVVDRVSEVLSSPTGRTLFARLADGSVFARPVR